MFSSALKSFSSNITANYTISTAPTSASGAWKVFDGKKKSTGKAVSVFVFDRKSLDPHSGGLSRGSGGASLKRLHDEVIARIKKEASLLARLRHPAILELAEPVEDTRNGGLMFATEPVTASLGGLLQDQDDQERAGSVSSRSSRFVVDESDGQRGRREFELDALEIQKGLLQVAQGLEFLHESAGLVHGNLTPEAIFVNAKSDWKIAGIAFAGPPDESSAQSNMPPLSLSEAMYHEPRLPRTIQLNLDYTSPDFAMDSNVTTAADMFSLGLLLIALYNSPHSSPIKSNCNLSTYKKIFSSSSTTPSISNNFLSSKPLPNDLKSAVLPRLISRRPANRMNARDFQQSAFFDNILVSAIRFLDTLPAKTPNEKSQFMRGLPKILDQFPKSVLDKKVLPALLEETKDKDLLALILQNAFKTIKILPSAQRAMSDKILPKIREVFLPNNKIVPGEKDSAKEAGLSVVLENVPLIGENCGGKEFKDYMLPVIIAGLESPTHAIVDKSFGCLRTILTILDFSSIKNELFPIVASVFSKTSSLGIKVRGLEAFCILCGGSPDDNTDLGADLDGAVLDSARNKAASNSVLDKYTVQEKIVPLLKGIKTKEPAVMMAVLKVFKQVGKIADSDFLAMETLPILWAFGLGPLLNLEQFQAYMTLIKALSSRIEEEQIKKLKEVTSTSGRSIDQARSNDLMNMGQSNGAINGVEDLGNDFESLVLGKRSASKVNNDMLGDIPSTQTQQQSYFSWQSQPSLTPPYQNSLKSNLNTHSRAITPDQTFNSLAAPSSSSGPNNGLANGAELTTFQPMQPAKPAPWPTLSAQQPQKSSQASFSMAPPQQTSTQTQQSNAYSGFSIAPPPASNSGWRQNSSSGLANVQMQASFGQQQQTNVQPQQQQQPQKLQKKSGLDAYQSLL